jgi:hypothetical protein
LFLPAFEPRTLAGDAQLTATIFPAERARYWRWTFELAAAR